MPRVNGMARSSTPANGRPGRGARRVLLVALLAAMLVAPGLAAPAAAEWVDWIGEARLRFTYDDNVNRSAFPADEENDFLWRPFVRGGRVFQLGEFTRLSLAAEAEGAIYHDWHDLDSVRLGGRAEVEHKLGIGPNQPHLGAHVFLGQLLVDDSRRNSMLVETGYRLAKAFGPRLDASIFGTYRYRDGRSGKVVSPAFDTNVWDQDGFETGALVSYLLLPQLLVSAGYSYFIGDFDSSCTVGNIGTVLSREGTNVKALAVNDVFGGCTYRLGGERHGAYVSLNYGLGDRFSVDLSYRFYQGHARELIYRTNLATVSVLYRY
jgi:hypothetical protein